MMDPLYQQQSLWSLGAAAVRPAWDPEVTPPRGAGDGNSPPLYPMMSVPLYAAGSSPQSAYHTSAAAAAPLYHGINLNNSNNNDNSGGFAPPLSPRMVQGHVGVGMLLQRRRDGFVVTEVDQNGPAQLAGIRVGDVLVGVGGVSTIGREYVSDLVGGVPNSFVELDIVKPGTTRAQRFMVMRVDRLVTPVMPTTELYPLPQLTPQQAAQAPMPPQQPRSINEPSLQAPAPPTSITPPPPQQPDPQLLARLAQAQARETELMQRVRQLEGEREGHAREVEAVRQQMEGRMRDVVSERDDALRSLQSRDAHLSEMEQALDSCRAQLAQSVPKAQVDGYALLRRKYEAQTAELARLQNENVTLTEANSVRSPPREDLRPRVTILEHQLQSLRGVQQEQQALKEELAKVTAERDRLRQEATTTKPRKFC